MSTHNLPFLLTELTSHRKKAPDAGLVLRRDNAYDVFPTLAVEVGFTESLEDLQEDAKRLLLHTNGGTTVVVLVKYTYSSNPLNLPADSWVEVWRLNVHGRPHKSVMRVSAQILN